MVLTILSNKQFTVHNINLKHFCTIFENLSKVLHARDIAKERPRRLTQPHQPVQPPTAPWLDARLLPRRTPAHRAPTCQVTNITRVNEALCPSWELLKAICWLHLNFIIKKQLFISYYLTKYKLKNTKLIRKK